MLSGESVGEKTMEKSAKTVLMIVVAVVIFIIGIFIGLGLTKSPASQIPGITIGTPAKNPLSSSVIASVFAFGKLTSVSGKNITLASGPDSLTIATDQNTKIVSYQQVKGADGKTTVSPQNIALSDLKTGDYLNVNLKVLASGTLNAVSINRVAATSPASATPPVPPK